MKRNKKYHSGKKYRRVMRKKDIVLKAMAEIPELADSLLSAWTLSARCLQFLIDDILSNDGSKTIITNKGKPIIKCSANECFSEKTFKYILLPFSAECITMHCALMDRLNADVEHDFCMLTEEDDNKWNELFSAIPCRFPALLNDCNLANDIRRELMTEVVDLFLGEKPAILTGKWLRLYHELSNALLGLQAKMNATMEGGAK